MKNNLTITVSGEINTGKSTISKVIYDALVTNGFMVDMKSDDFNGERMNDRVNGLREITKININQITTNRDGEFKQ
jgi:pantothenate kinase-related protein Tda10